MDDQIPQHSLLPRPAEPVPAAPTMAADTYGFPINGILPGRFGAPPVTATSPASSVDGESSPIGPAFVNSDSNPFARFLNALNPISSANAAEDEGGGLPPALALAIAQGLLDVATAKRLVEQQKILKEAVDARQDLFDVAQGKASPRALGRVLEISGIQRPKGYEAHHIVAGDAEDAEPARQILKKLGIGINNVANGAFLPAEEDTVKLGNEAVHGSLHTKSYYDRVNAIITKATTKQEAITLLQLIGRALRSGDFP